LTGLANRRTFETFLQAALANTNKIGGTAVLLIDLDHFKSINDRYGHQVGDQCLQSLALLLVSLDRLPNSLAARYGGEEFVIVYNADNEEQALLDAAFVCRRIEAMRIPLEGEHSMTITASIGVSFTPRSDASEMNDLILRADKALYVTAPTLTSRDHVYRVHLNGQVETAWTGFGRPSSSQTTPRFAS